MNSEKQYIQAFNKGYILAEHEPYLVIALSLNPIPNYYFEGLLAGSQQFRFDMEKEQLCDIEKLRNLSQSNNKELGRK
ncbi:MAG TPA: hypothetical protein DCQ50_21010 [Chryseobacterium sp.]|nr:hypothetical protein [Chryseobacterium sp.]